MRWPTLSMRWRRVDLPGRDICRLDLRPEGPALLGHASFRLGGVEARLTYQLGCDRAWRTRRGRVRGAVGSRPVDVSIERDEDGRWTVDGRPSPGLDGLEHLDLGFSPATNLPQLRALHLAEGAVADLPVAWMDVPPSELRLLRQRYERRGALTYWYEAPAFGYSGLLVLAPSGFVRSYPALWEQLDWSAASRARSRALATPRAARARPPPLRLPQPRGIPEVGIVARRLQGPSPGGPRCRGDAPR